MALTPHSSNDQDVAPPGSWTCNAVALVGVTATAREDALALAHVIEVVEKPAGQVVHLRLPADVINGYRALDCRAITPV